MDEMEINNGQKTQKEEIVFFSEGSIKDWKGLLIKLKEHGSGDTERIWELLDEECRNIIIEHKQDEAINTESREIILNRLNKMLKIIDFFDCDKFDIEKLSEDAKFLLGKELAKLSEEDLWKFNRMLIESIFPLEIRKRQRQEDILWAKDQIDKFEKKRPSYELLTETIEKIFRQFSIKKIRLCIIESRTKTITSFAEKIQRKRIKYNDPVNQLTDLCGVRLITYTPDDLQEVCKFVEKNFEIDRENSVDVDQRHKISEFGYRSIHYIVKLIPGVLSDDGFEIEIPDDCYNLKAEIQIRTILEHSWADFFHHVGYKKGYKIPEDIERELYRLAAILENTDKTFSRIKAGLGQYFSHFNLYMSDDKIRNEIELMETVLEYDKENIKLIHKTGRLAMALCDWDKAIQIMEPFVSSGYKPLLKDLGIAKYKQNKEHPYSDPSKDARSILTTAGSPPNIEPEALIALANSLRSIQSPDAGEKYKKAFEIDPTNPYTLSEFLEWKLWGGGYIPILEQLQPTIRAAIERCQDEIEMGIKVLWNHINLGKFFIIMGKSNMGFQYFARGLQLCDNKEILESVSRQLKNLSMARRELNNFGWLETLLYCRLASKFKDKEAIEWLKARATHASEQIKGQVVIVAGWCDKKYDEEMMEYRKLLIEAFDNFKGTIFSGGTKAGISGAIGEIREKHPDMITTIGYLPWKRPDEDEIDERYTKVIEVKGENGYSIAEPLQTWIDIIASGIDPSEVRLIGINGGDISSFEYKIALTLGAMVGVLQGSGREAARLIQDDKAWGASPNLLCLPDDREILKAFIIGNRSRLEPGIREQMAQRIYKTYNDFKKKEMEEEFLLKTWDKLSDNLKDSNRFQADAIFEKLEEIGCSLCEKERGEIKEIEFSDEEIELMAKMEHGRWTIERLLDHWKPGEEKDVEKKISPYLVPWSDLSEHIKEYDRIFVRKYPEYLKNSGYEIFRKT